MSEEDMNALVDKHLDKHLKTFFVQLDEKMDKKIDSLRDSFKEDMREIKGEIQKVVESLTHKVEVLSNEIYELRRENDSLTNQVAAANRDIAATNEKVTKMQTEQEEAKKKHNDLEQYTRRWSLRVYKLPEKEGETVEECIDSCCRLFTEKVGVTVTRDDIEIAHRTGPKDNQNGGAGGNARPRPRPRPVIIRFFSRLKRGEVLEKRRCLKGLGVSIGEDMTTANFKLLKAAEDHSATMAAWFAKGNVYAKLKNNRVIKLDVSENVNDVLKC